MDDTDRKLIILICQDPRMPSREIAKKLGISRQAVHHRMQVLTDLGVFRSVKATLTRGYLDFVTVAIWGKSETGSVEDTLDKLGQSEFTWNVRVGGGNELLVTGCLRNMSELNSYVEFVKDKGRMSQPIVGITSLDDGINLPGCDGPTPKENYRELSPLELKIIACLQDNVRRPFAEIAKALGVSTKTIRRHLERMKAEGTIDFDVPLDVSGEDMWTWVYVTLRSNCDKVRVARRLISKDPLHLVMVRAYSNLPSFLIGFINSDNMTEIRRLLEEIDRDEDVVSVTPNLMYKERMYTSWDYKIPAALSRFPVMSKDLTKAKGK